MHSVSRWFVIEAGRADCPRRFSMSLRRLAAFVSSFLALSIGACSTHSDNPREAAITHALANPDLQRSVATFTGLGWVVSDRAAASVEWLDTATSPQFRSTAAPATWTRVRIPMLRAIQLGKPGVGADLVVAWPEDGVDELAVMPHSEAAGTRLALDLKTIDGSSVQDLLSLDAPAASAAACGRENAACGGATTCCRGLVCAEPRDNHFICYCSQPVTLQYNDGATLSAACFSLFDNPIGAARWVRTIRGCGPGGSIGADACGHPWTGPAYTRSNTRVLMCYDTPPRGCVSEE